MLQLEIDYSSQLFNMIFRTWQTLNKGQRLGVRRCSRLFVVKRGRGGQIKIGIDIEIAHCNEKMPETARIQYR